MKKLFSNTLAIILLFIRKRADLVISAIIAVLIGTIIVNLLKTTSGMLRPAAVLNHELINIIGPVLTRHSFPSGHTADNFAAAAVLTLFYRRRGWLYFFVAAAVGYSRIYTGSHWPSDVLASAFLGTGFGVLGVATAEGIWRRWGGSLAPRLYRRHPSLLENCVAEERGL